LNILSHLTYQINQVCSKISTQYFLFFCHLDKTFGSQNWISHLSWHVR